MPIFKRLVPEKDFQVFVLTTLENPPIYIFLKWNNVSLKRPPDAFKYQSTFFLYILCNCKQKFSYSYYKKEHATISKCPFIETLQVVFRGSTTNINFLLNVIRREKKVEDNFPKLSTEDCFN